MKSRVQTLILLAACYFGAVGYGAVYLLIEHTTKQLSGSAVDAGNFLLFSGIAALSVTGFSGRLSRRWGAHKISALGVFCTTLGMLCLSGLKAVSVSYYLAGLFVGIGWSLCYAASPMLVLSPIISETEQGRLMSLISACVVLGTATLPSVSNLLSNTFDTTLLLLLSSLIGVASLVLYLWAGSLLSIVPVKEGHSKESVLSDFLLILKTEALYPLIMVFLGACVVTTLLNFQTTYAQERELNYVLFYGVYAAMNISSRLFFGGVLTRKNPLYPVPLLMGIMLCGLSLLILNHGSALLYVLSAVFLGTAYGLSYPLIKTYALRVTKPAQRHEVLAGFTLSYFIGMYLFPIVAALIQERVGLNAVFLVLIALSGIYLYIALSRRKSAHALLEAGATS